MYLSFSWGTIIQNAVGWSNSLCGEWWFFKSYVICLLLSPIWFSFIKNKNACTEIFSWLLLSITGAYLLPNLSKAANIPLNKSQLFNLLFCQTDFTICFYFGALLAKNKRLERIDQALSTNSLNNLIVDFVALGLVFFARNKIVGAQFDFFYCLVILLHFTHIARRLKIVGALSVVFGKHSTNIWLFHSFFIYNFGLWWQKFIFFPRNPFLITAWCSAFCLAVSVLLNLFYQEIGNIQIFLQKKLKNRGAFQSEDR